MIPDGHGSDCLFQANHSKASDSKVAEEVVTRAKKGDEVETLAKVVPKEVMKGLLSQQDHGCP